LLEIWETIREDYYKTSNPKQYEADLAKQKRIELLRAEIIGCTAGISCFELTNEILPIFKEFGYDVRDVSGIKKVKQKLLVKNTKLTLLIATQEANRKKTDNNEKIDFDEQVVDLESALNQLNLLHGQIDIDKTTVARWINYIKSIKKANVRDNKQR